MSVEQHSYVRPNKNHSTFGIPLSVLDVAPIIEGGTIANSLRNTLDLAQHSERWGYTRYWLAEHHNSPSIASSATSVVIGHVAGGTSTIRVGAGGIMLPNHAPLVIAEQFGTLDALYPGRIDLGLGRAPGTDGLTAAALRGQRRGNGGDFPELLDQLRAYLDPTRAETAMAVRAYPGEGADVPIWLLGSSDFSAMLAAELGLPFAFAGHFSPTFTVPAMNLYRNNFKPSAMLAEPYAMVAVNVVAAETDEEAAFLATTLQQYFLGFIRNRRAPLPPPVRSMDGLWTAQEKYALEQQLGSSIAGSPATVKTKLEKYIELTGANEVMIAAHIYDHTARLRSYEIIANI
ncbi:LLM class flavin-dependent oxidoreductase [Paenibacillus sp. GSMTC-2017]|uniref:LLM class flavin-dependent oxidoreductase n=1 Tax=Paenibacillus sp. GSMTC-2017 TaxID=2794350 RepID=UPI0018DA0A34|nr:LLM class flavin-dependent oxidoreductase [Paenibacillus sp. GSMTC-2017]MBH5319061.1 LLM class flavin-dependent oxidoreductase [Paenibacillus sp. GSMTC-2017]